MGEGHVMGRQDVLQGIFGLSSESGCHVGVDCQRCEVPLYFLGHRLGCKKIGTMFLILIVSCFLVNTLAWCHARSTCRSYISKTPFEFWKYFIIYFLI